MIREAPILLVCATRAPDIKTFLEERPLGRSVMATGLDVRWFVATGGNDGLPEVYNKAIDAPGPEDEILVFAHDDLHLIDIFWQDRVRLSLHVFDVAGITGNRRRVPRQPSWCFLNDKFERDDRANLSGRAAHGKSFPAHVDVYGPTLRRCVLMDGMFLAAQRKTFALGLRFDERFKFEFYDLDFCRLAEWLGLSMSTCPISVIHESAGNFNSPEWRAGYAAYLEKWKE